MTHFTVLVRYEGDIADAEAKIGGMLAPFDENKQVPRYKLRMKKKSVQHALEYFNKKRGMSSSGVTVGETELTPEEIKEYEGAEGGKDGRGYFYWSTYNKLSKWDWYEIGGRWQGMLMLKADAQGTYYRKPNIDRHDLSIMEQLKKVSGKSGTQIDLAYLKDVDWERMSVMETARVTEDYYRAVEFVLKELDTGKKFDDLVASLYFEYDVSDESLEERIERVRRFATHAVVDEHGWHEWSKMGWWAVTYDEKESQADWNAKFAGRFLSNPTEKTVIVVVDCHI